jgi:hypothetical protein
MGNYTRVRTIGERKYLNVAAETYDRLKTFGKFGESFDDLLNKLMDTSTSGNPARDSSFDRITTTNRQVASDGGSSQE